MTDRKPCRCLLAQSGQADLARTVAEYIASLPEDLLAPTGVREERLAVCLQCPWLADGTCARCGCYTEARAAKAGQRCPDTPPRWR